MDDPIDRKRTCVVIGGRGFIGKWLVLRLLKLGDWIVRVADSPPSLQLDTSTGLDSLLSDAVSSGLASYHSVDVRCRLSIFKAIEGSNVVFYMDVPDLCNQDFYNSYKIIVQGAKNVVSVCRECKVKQLIYNSSTDVVVDGSRDIIKSDESIPYPCKHQDMLTDLRAQAEALILLANDVDGLLTCVLRPSNVFGPGDTQFVPFLVKGAGAAWTKFIIGGGENMSDFTYVENVAHANICAEAALRTSTVSVAGKAFFITNNEPVKFWDFVTLLLEGLGYERPYIKLPVKMVYCILLLFEWIHEMFGISKGNHVMSAHQFVHLASRTRTFDCCAAQTHLGYSPVIPLADSISRTVNSFCHISRDSAYLADSDFPECSKAERLLGSGKSLKNEYTVLVLGIYSIVAEILLWRDEKTTFACFVVSFLLFYWFFLSGRSFVSSTANLILVVTTVLYGYACLPLILSGFTFPQVSLNFSDIHKGLLRDSVRSILSFWNGGVRVTRQLARGEDWNTFLKVAFSLYALELILSRSMIFTIGVALASSFTFFFIYEQYESKIDKLVRMLISQTTNWRWLLKNVCVSSST